MNIQDFGSNGVVSQQISSPPDHFDDGGDGSDLIELDRQADEAAESQEDLDIIANVSGGHVGIDEGDDEDILGNADDITDDRYNLLKNAFSLIIKGTRLSSISSDEIYTSINTYCTRVDQDTFTLVEYHGALRRLCDEDLIMVSEGQIYPLQ
eukprot:gnl/Chilomastix_caulleri/3860.p1 GENE.gnl/Chilomastix_caulleri/3860~~gnl/Chilomastix_caulleri/3860.p1  ORF type:complete len:152 (+),score=29.18 gnl/Chilomastix_caulleri/3860:127-582(+)